MKEIILNYEQRITYNNLVDKLKRHERVAIIQPTGTGKSYIALKYIQDKPNTKALFVTSYNSAVENIKDIKKIYLKDRELDVVGYRSVILDKIPKKDYDIIVFDEYHHCGAEVTNKMISKLIEENPNAKIIGTTATPVRYLDNQRDMTTEIFSDITARDMSLAYAIANKLLPEFDYVTGLYEYKKDQLIEEYTNSIKRVPNEEMSQYIKYINDLKIILENATGINEIFKKYINKKGKYIVFCNTKEEIEEFTKKLKSKELDWFDGISDDIEINTLLYSNPTKKNNKELENFRKPSNGIKLLFNINMASESVHFDDIDGIIMLRSTQSKNLYEQQLGRALSVNSNKRPIIFDFANNIHSDFIYDVISDVNREITKRNHTELNDSKENLKIGVVDEVNSINKILSKLNEMKSQKSEYYLQKIQNIYNQNQKMFNSTFDKIPKINIIDNNSIEVVENVKSIFGEEIYEYLVEQKRDYNSNRMHINKYNFFRSIGLVSDIEPLNKRDLEDYKNLLRMFKEERDESIKEAFNFIIKFVDIYYIRKENQNYDLADFAQYCILGYLNAKKIEGKNYAFNIYALQEIRKELNILSKEKMTEKIPVVQTEDLMEDTVCKNEIREVVRDFLDLNPNKLRQRKIDSTKMKYGFDDVPDADTLDEIGKLYGVTRSTIGQDIHKVQRLLIPYLRSKKLDLSDYYDVDAAKIERRKSLGQEMLKYIEELDTPLKEYLLDMAKTGDVDRHSQLIKIINENSYLKSWYDTIKKDKLYNRV